MVNTLGKFLRKLRIDRDELMADMARNLGVSSAFLSQIENGKKPPKNWENNFLAKYDLSSEQEREFRDCVFAVRNSQSIDLSKYSQEDQNLLIHFAKNIHRLNDEQRNTIFHILNNF